MVFSRGDIQVDVSLERLKRFFNKEDGGYRIRKELRERVVFTPHNLLSDPPFSRLDMVVCRNLLIYLQRDVQKDIFELFHYALLPSAYMVLGTSESQEASELFRTESKELSIFRKKNINGPEPKLPVFPRMNKSFHEKTNEGSLQPPVSQGVLHQKLVERYGPPSLLLSPDYQVMHVSENAGRYLRIQGGEFSRDLFKLVRTEFSPELRSTLHLAKEEKKTVRSKPVDLQIDGKTQRLVISVRVIDEQANENMILVMFEEYDLREKLPTNEIKEKSDAVTARRIEELEEELNEKRQQLQSIIEEYETSREEMRASNEELQSSNEELRSTLEELETSKEELQSVNEELTTLNQENRHKVAELSQMSDDLQNLLASTQIATLFLNREFRIMRYTPRLGELFNIRPADRGRLISDITNKMNYDELVPDAKKVIKSLQPVEREIEDTNGNTYLTRLLPYRSTDDKIDGVVITFIDISGRINAQKELEKEKTYAESIFETMHEPLLVLNPDLTVKSTNQAFYDHFEVKEAETIGRKIYQLGNNQWDIPALRKLLEEVLPDSNVFNDFEVEHEFEDIGRRIMLVNARRLDHVQLILLGIRDITERKQREEMIRNSEERLRLTMDATDIGSWMRDEGDVVEYMDENNISLLGLSDGKNDFTLEEIYKCIHPEDKDKVSHAVKKAWDEKGEFNLEFRIGTKKDFRWLASRGRIIKPNDKHKMIGINYDITERKRHEEELGLSKEKYQNLFDSIDEGFCIIEVIFDEKDKVVDYRFLEINPAFEKHTGIKNATGKRMREVEPSHEEHWFETYGRIAKTGKSERFVNYAKYLDNRWYDVYAFCVGEPQGNKVAVIFNDISAKKKYEKELYEAREEAEEAARAKEDFLAHMSHEIRTPLNAVAGLSHLLLKHNHLPEQRENLHNLKIAADNLNRLINDILDFSKIQAGKVQMEVETIDFKEFLKDVFKVHRGQADDKRLKLEYNLDSDIPRVLRFDGLKLSHVLHNLLSNAVKFTPEGYIRLDVNLKKKEKKNLWLKFSVRDSGIGIPGDKLESIFDVFSQADNSTVRTYGGTGLGLTITKLYLEMMGSSIEVESVEGKGSVFSFVLKVEEDGEPAKVQQQKYEPKYAEIDLNQLCVLIVEDDEYNRMIMEQLFEMWEVDYDTAGNGKQALEQAASNKYDLILMDVRMPVMDGYEATRKIRELSGYNNVPVIALTADISQSVKREVQKGLFDDLSLKPVDPDNMNLMIRRVLAQRQKG
ncbi:MAG: PAS domain-containing protein [Bacteroidales bacterium]|nr:PAS domain-containing protein [Bacteroidales bacterium]MCF8352497.1 PAS domain-containing protein [Bacteroidales bacterium]MCF8374939.1 PAS domain-containing protein [Bacteroidales bacterium]MCF8400082.1 PAS domain-containing protein [Bacteroidales bacterium]